MRTVPFVKMSGTGNDFVMVDNRSGALKESDLAALARAACPRGTAVGADGVVLIEPAQAPGHAYRMRIFNADGSEAEMCGNASRCVAVLAAQLGVAGREQVIETIAGTLHATAAPDGRSAKVQLSPPGRMKLKKGLRAAGRSRDCYFINTGVPHAVCYVKDVSKVKVRKLGRAIRYHAAFKPKGTNANFVELPGDGAIRLRTYERGVEDETLACGTGAVASAIIAAESEKMSSPITIETQSGEKLKVYFESVKGRFKNVYLEGKAKLVYEGVLFE